MRTETPAPPWWVDLVHPVPLGAAALLFANDHALKGAGLLPAWLTGKLSDVAGLFVLPIVVVSCLRWAAAVLGRPLSRGRTLVWAVTIGTAVLFTAMKLSVVVNRWVSGILGPNSMDPTDLLALAVLVPCGLWLLRPVRPRPEGRSLRTAAAAFAALACAATSKKAEPRPPPQDAVALQKRDKPCASVAAVTCRHDATRFVVRLSAQMNDSTSCRVRITAVSTERGENGQGAANGTLVDGPAFDLDARNAALIGAWGRLGEAGQSWARARVWWLSEGRDAEGPTTHGDQVIVPCRPGFGEDTQPAVQVAK
jgi:hypothetical protein